MLERIVCSNAIFVEVCMEFLYPFLIAFIMVFIAELGDKTQLLVLSFAGGVKTRQILFGIAIGSFFSHGIAILFGSSLTLLDNPTIHLTLKLITYFSFIFMGILSFLPQCGEPPSQDHPVSEPRRGVEYRRKSHRSPGTVQDDSIRYTKRRNRPWKDRPGSCPPA